MSRKFLDSLNPLNFLTVTADFSMITWLKRCEFRLQLENSIARVQRFYAICDFPSLVWTKNMIREFIHRNTIVALCRPTVVSMSNTSANLVAL